MKAILMALLMVVSFSIVGCGEEEHEAGTPEIKVTTPPAKAVEDAKEEGKEAVDDAKKKASDLLGD